MNYIEMASDTFDAVLFADDSTFIAKIRASLPSKCINKSFEDVINREPEKVYDWLIVNKLSLNIKKTKCMIFHTPNTKFIFIPTLIINNTQIERVTNSNFLGLTINENLSWKPHVDRIANKISKTGGFIKRLKHFLPLHILRIINCRTIQ